MAIPKPLPSYEYLVECFSILSGKLVWKKRPLSHFGSSRSQRGFNTTFSGRLCPQEIPKGGRYLIVKLSGFGNIKQHRILASLYNKRCILPEEIVDHIDGDTQNNSDTNLRLVNYSNNSRNQKLFDTNTSGTRGVYKLLNKDGNLFYRAQWFEGSVRKNKSFSFSRFGEQGAFHLACEARRQQIERIGGYIER